MYYRVHISPTIDPILSQMDAIIIPTARHLVNVNTVNPRYNGQRLDARNCEFLEMMRH
jgi:hypothetical protein